MEVSEKIALFDLDGTLADYDGQLQKDLALLGPPLDPADPYAEQYMDQRRFLIRSQRNWWTNLAPIEEGLGLFSMAVEMGFTPHVLTKGPSRTADAWGEKVLWCRKHLDPLYGNPVDISITTDKGLTYGTLLVDDYPDYIKRWLEWRPRGVVFMPDRDWNKEFEHPQVMRVTNLTSYPVVQAKLREAYNR